MTLWGTRSSEHVKSQRPAATAWLTFVEVPAACSLQYVASPIAKLRRCNRKNGMRKQWVSLLNGVVECNGSVGA